MSVWKNKLETDYLVDQDGNCGIILKQTLRKQINISYLSGFYLCTGRYTWMNINGWMDRRNDNRTKGQTNKNK
jgi:hypothetical protein